jgi:hypothetical protein
LPVTIPILLERRRTSNAKFCSRKCRQNVIEGGCWFRNLRPYPLNTGCLRARSRLLFAQRRRQLARCARSNSHHSCGLAPATLAIKLNQQQQTFDTPLTHFQRLLPLTWCRCNPKHSAVADRAKGPQCAALRTLYGHEAQSPHRTIHLVQSMKVQQWTYMRSPPVSQHADARGFAGGPAATMRREQNKIARESLGED